MVVHCVLVFVGELSEVVAESKESESVVVTRQRAWPERRARKNATKIKLMSYVANRA